MERAWQGGQGTVSGCDKEAAAGVPVCVIFAFAWQVGWALLTVVMLHFLVLAVSPPCPSPQVALPLSGHSCHTASPPSMCVCVCSAQGGFLFATHMLLPIRVCSLVIWTLEAMSCRLCPCQRILEWLFFASEGGQTSSLFCSLPRTTLTSSWRPAGSSD